MIESALCINSKVVNFDKLYFQAEERDEIQFKNFKQIVLSLFGSNLFTLSCVDIDSILRKVHRELIVIVGEEPPSTNQEMKKTNIKNVTDEDLANLCTHSHHIEDSCTAAKRAVY